MELEKLFACKNIQPSSLNYYISNLKRLNNNKEIKNLNFLNNKDKIMGLLEKYKKSTQRNYIATIVSVLKCYEKNKKLYDYYLKIMIRLNNELKDQTELRPSESENWKDFDEIKQIHDNKQDEFNTLVSKNNITRDDYNKILEFVILSLYVMIPPRRNQDYQYMIINGQPIDINVFDMSDKTFKFGKYKTKTTYGVQTLDVPNELYNILVRYIRVKPINEFLLVDYDGRPLINHTNSITRILNKIFGKKIGVSMLRKIYLSSKYSNNNNNLYNDTQAMGTSVGNANTQYIKKV